MKVRAAVLYEAGKKFPYTESLPLTVETVELDAPGPGEVLVEVAKAGICHSDLSVVDGTRPRPTPMVLGHEASGIVRELGTGVADLHPGDHVVFSFVPMCGRCVSCASGRPALCEPGNLANARGTLLGGSARFRTEKGVAMYQHLGVSAFSEFTVVARESLVLIDPAIPLDIAAVFGCAIQTGVGSVVNTAGVKPGASVAVFGAGGIGLSALMGARLAGAYPIIAVDLIVEKLQLAQRVGATHVVNAQEGSPVESVRAIVPGGVSFAFEAAGSEQALSQAYQATGRGGTTISIGLVHPSKSFSAQALSIVVEERTIKGSYMGSSVPTRDIPRLLGLYQAGLLPTDVLVSRTLPMTDINRGIESLRRSEVVRQLVDPKE